MTDNQEAIQHLNWVLNRYRESEFYKVSSYDTDTLRITMIGHGLMFQHDLPDLLNNMGFEIYAIDPTDDRVSLLIKDRRRKK